MHRRLLVFLFGVLLAASAADAADVPRLADIPSDVAVAHPGLVSLRAKLVQDRNVLRSRTQSHNTSCASVVAGSAADAACTRENAQLAGDLDAHIAASNRFNASVAANAATRQYIPSGNGLVGGMTWITGFNERTLTPEQRARLEQRLFEQMDRVGMPRASIDTERYNFVIGVAASTQPFTDLANRVVFDELRLGRFSREHQTLYASLKGRSFDELSCHSNGAMVCLAALTNKDVKATHVVLYGPQVTPESLMIYNKLLESRQIQSLKIHINQNDPVPPTALLASGPDMALAATFAPFLATALYTTPALTKTISFFAPGATVQAHSCTQGFGAACHVMTSYRSKP